jgi:hypothetical protein
MDRDGGLRLNYGSVLLKLGGIRCDPESRERQPISGKERIPLMLFNIDLISQLSLIIVQEKGNQNAYQL